MLKVLSYIFLVALIIAVSVWVFFNPGEVEIRWLGWQVTTSVAVVIVAFILLMLVFKIISLPWAAADAMRAYKRKRARQEKKKLLIDYLTALGAADTAKYPALYKRIKNLFMDKPELANLLLLNIAGEAQKNAILEDLAGEKDTALLALKHQIDHAMNLRKMDKALELYAKAFTDFPKAKWVAKPYINLLALFEKWDEVMRVAKLARARGAVDRAYARRVAAAATLEKGLELAQDDMVLKAATIDNSYAPAVLAAVKIKAKAGKVWTAKRELYRLWSKEPSLEVYRTLAEITAGEPASRRVKAVMKLTRARDFGGFNDIVLADIYAKTGLLGKAKDYAEKYLAFYPDSAFGAVVMAKITAAENKDSDEAARWKLKAEAKAAEVAGYVCSECGKRYKSSHALCPNCQSFASVTVFLGGE